MSRKSSGFTLVELLVAVAIVSILFGLLFSAFTHVREGAQQATCLSNLRQLGVAVFQYAQDYDDRYPYGGDPGDLNTDGWQFSDGGKYWPAIREMRASNRTLPNVMRGYVKDHDLWRCPSDSGFDMGGQHEDIPMNASPTAFLAYGMSYAYTTQLALEGQTISGVRAWSRDPPYSEHSPADVPLFYDLVGHWHGGTAQSAERLNFVMVDGHSQAIGRDRADALNRILFTIPSPQL